VSAVKAEQEGFHSTSARASVDVSKHCSSFVERQIHPRRRSSKFCGFVDTVPGVIDQATIHFDRFSNRKGAPALWPTNQLQKRIAGSKRSLRQIRNLLILPCVKTGANSDEVHYAPGWEHQHPEHVSYKTRQKRACKKADCDADNRTPTKQGSFRLWFNKYLIQPQIATIKSQTSQSYCAMLD